MSLLTSQFKKAVPNADYATNFTYNRIFNRTFKARLHDASYVVCDCHYGVRKQLLWNYYFCLSVTGKI